MKVFQLNDCDWYMAETLEEAIEEAMMLTGLPRDESVDDPREVGDTEMDQLVFVADDGNERTFREELERRILVGDVMPQLFASTEL